MWGWGYGIELVTLVLDYGFNALGMHNIMMSAFRNDEPAIRRRECVWREVVRRCARLYDDIFMECLATEFSGPLPPGAPTPEEALANEWSARWPAHPAARRC